MLILSPWDLVDRYCGILETTLIFRVAHVAVQPSSHHDPARARLYLAGRTRRERRRHLGRPAQGLQGQDRVVEGWVCLRQCRGG